MRLGWFAPVSALLLVAGPVGAFTPAEIDAAAAVARAGVEADVRTLAADDFSGRGSGDPGAALAREFLLDRLEAIGPGLGAGTGREAYEQPFDLVRSNLLALIPGGARADEYVVVGAHYDHLAPDDCSSLGGGDTICNGAADNASGVGVVLAIGRALRALPAPPARSVVLALWDGEEIGLLGSKHFAQNPIVALEDIAAYVNFDIQGSNLSPSTRDVSFAIGAESGGELLTALTRDAIAAVGLDTQLLSTTFGQARSDYQPFWIRGVPVTFFSDATNACYHTSGDEVEVVDFAKLRRQTEIGFRLALALAGSEERPAFAGLAQFDTYEDLLVLSEFLTLALADLAWMHPGYDDALVSLEAEARAAVEAGPEAFGPTDALLIAQEALGIATGGFPCDPLLLPEPAAGGSAALLALARIARRRVVAGRRIR
jgi:hypothetical protein